MKRKVKLYLILFLVMTFCACGQKNSSQEYAPDFTLPDLNGHKISLSDFRGKVVVLDFFTTWCEGCRMLAPQLNRLYQKYKKSDVLILGISLDGFSTSKPLYKFQQKEKISYPLLIGNEEVVRKYGDISIIPYVVIIDTQGKIYKILQGHIEEEKLEKYIKTLLSKRG
ncbi:MAG: TlpA family protein disulfide reductase [Candidatus Desulfofervidaceae bacterium]|nr:TlpA family protein disulfide reductase [Candidatus Desulfofervidaceae bacterium]